jgi:hypothetical protein
MRRQADVSYPTRLDSGSGSGWLDLHNTKATSGAGLGFGIVHPARLPSSALPLRVGKAWQLAAILLAFVITLIGVVASLLARVL